MRILTAGGGSGGHVTPVVAVLRELHKTHPDAEVRFWCDRKFERQAKGLMHEFDPNLRVEVVMSGKLRRYNSLPVWKQLLRPLTIVGPNILDMLKVVAGTIQCFGKLLVWRPDVVFTKGGYVCLPVGVAANLLRIPLVIHDSDAHPGLTNRILSRWATRIATGAPLEYYSYPPDRTDYVGIPIDDKFVPPSPDRQRSLKQKLGFDGERPLVVVTGGGLGAERINNAMVQVIPSFAQSADFVLISGTAQFDELRTKLGEDNAHMQLHSFVSGNMDEFLAAADVVVARAGMTTILELAALARPTILVPNAYLTGGHQLKNAKVYADKDAVEIADEHKFEHNPELLAEQISALLKSPERRASLSGALHEFARPHAASDMAAIIGEVIVANHS